MIKNSYEGHFRNFLLFSISGHGKWTHDLKNACKITNLQITRRSIFIANNRKKKTSGTQGKNQRQRGKVLQQKDWFVDLTCVLWCLNVNLLLGNFFISISDKLLTKTKARQINYNNNQFLLTHILCISVATTELLSLLNKERKL